MSAKDLFYKKSPYFIKLILINLMSISNHRKRYTDNYKKLKETYHENWFKNMDDLKSIQETELKKLLLECYEFVPYYKEIFEKLKFNKEKIEHNPFEVLKLLPILNKNIRKEKVELLINSNPERPIVDVGFTSGTSGTPTKNYIDLESNERSFALWHRFHQVIGLPKKYKTIRFSGRLIVNPDSSKPPFWIENIIDKQLFMSSYHLKWENLDSYVKKINNYQPDLIEGYPSAIYILSQYINKNKIRLSFRPIAICTTAETLYDYQREEIEKAFKCKVYNQYASSEGSPFITECVSGKLHLNIDSGVFEILDENNENTLPGQIGRLVVTSFRNLKVPLLRYNIEDTVQLSEDKSICICGCEMPYLDKIIGREDDLLYTLEKGYVGRMDTAYKGLIGIVKSQIIQVDLNNFIINQIIDDAYTLEIEKKFVQNLKDRLGRNINFEINIVDEIELGPNGKFDAVKREFELNENLP